MPPLVDVIIPVYNEEKDLPKCVVSLSQFLEANLFYPWRIVIADNGSTDSTPAVADMLSHEYPNVKCIHLEMKGRGRALRKAWLESEADILTYMDVDLSTDLKAFPKLVKAIGEEGYDLGIGSRLMKGAKVTRSLKREVISRLYNLIIRAMFFTRFKDAQCGFKGMSRRAVRALVPRVEDQAWFFDSELLILAEKSGLRIKEIPVTWIDDPDSRVNVTRTATEDLKGLLRLRLGGLARALKELPSIEEAGEERPGQGG
ncbi:MAG: glycosyltransferase family 2 protein [Chloroflexi bacterium]|nr:glycosyltransferase family 2 protein [Chloroflexota bacterium]